MVNVCLLCKGAVNGTAFVIWYSGLSVQTQVYCWWCEGYLVWNFCGNSAVNLILLADWAFHTQEYRRILLNTEIILLLLRCVLLCVLLLHSQYNSDELNVNPAENPVRINCNALPKVADLRIIELNSLIIIHFHWSKTKNCEGFAIIKFLIIFEQFKWYYLLIF